MDAEWTKQLEEFARKSDVVESDIYEQDFVDRLLEDDELSFEEAAFMMGYVESS